MRDELDAVGGALALAANVLVHDPSQIGPQLVGRLIEADAPGLERLRAGALARATVWPLLPGLTPPGGPLVGTIPAREGEYGAGQLLGGAGPVAVHAITVLPDGRTAVVGYEDGEIHAFAVATGVHAWERRHDGDILSLAADPRGERIVSGSADGTVRILDARLGDDVGMLGRHDGDVRKVAISPCGRVAFSASIDGEVRSWDLEGRREIGRLSARGPFAVAPDGRAIYGVASDGSIRVWDVPSFGAERLCAPDAMDALAMEVTPDGGRLVTVSHEEGELATAPERMATRVLLNVFDVRGSTAPSTGTHVEPATGVFHLGWASLAVAADSRFAVTGSLGTRALLWDLGDVGRPSTMSVHSSQVLATATTPDARRALTGSRDGTIRIWDPERVRDPLHVATHAGEVNGVSATPDGRRAVTVASDGSLAVWDLLPERAGRAVPCTAGPCWSVAVSDDGARAVVGGSEGVVVVVDLATGTETARHVHPGGHVLAVGWSASGHGVWAVGVDGRRMAWDVDTGTDAEVPTETSGSVLFGLAVTPDGDRVIAGRPDGTVVTARRAEPGATRTLGRHGARVRSAALTADGRVALTGAADGEIIVWDLQRLESRHRLTLHDAVVMALAVTPDGRVAASAGWDSTLALWDLERGALLAAFGTDGRLISVALSANGALCVAGEQSGRVHALLTPYGAALANAAVAGAAPAIGPSPTTGDFDARDAAAAAELERLLAGEPGNTEHAQRLALSYGALARSSGSEGSVEWLGYAIRARDLLRGLRAAGTSLSTDAAETLGSLEEALVASRRAIGPSFDHLAIPPASLHLHEPSGPAFEHGGGPVFAVAAIPDGRRLASAGGDGAIRVWDLERRAETATLRGHDAPVLAVAVTPDGGLVVSGSWDGTVRVWDPTSGAQRQVWGVTDDGVFAVAVTPDGRHVVSGGGDHTVRVWDLANGTQLDVWRGHEGRVMTLAVAPDGSSVASGSEDGTVRLWDVASGDSRVLTGHESGVLAVAFAPDGRRMVSGSFDQTVKLWDRDRGDATATLAGHYDAVRSVVVTPDGRRFASACFDGSIRVWDIEWLAEVTTLIDHTDAVVALALLPDGRRLASGSNDGTVRVWDLLLQGGAAQPQ